jgi:hypothetical protein
VCVFILSAVYDRGVTRTGLPAAPGRENFHGGPFDDARVRDNSRDGIEIAGLHPSCGFTVMSEGCRRSKRRL